MVSKPRAREERPSGVVAIAQPVLLSVPAVSCAVEHGVSPSAKVARMSRVMMFHRHQEGMEKCITHEAFWKEQGVHPSWSEMT